MNETIEDHNRNNNLDNLITEYNLFNKDIENVVNDIKLNKISNPNDKQKNCIIIGKNYVKILEV